MIASKIVFTECYLLCYDYIIAAFPPSLYSQLLASKNDCPSECTADSLVQPAADYPPAEQEFVIRDAAVVTASGQVYPLHEVARLVHDRLKMV